MVFSSIVQQQLLESQRERKLDLNAPLMSVRRQQRIQAVQHHLHLQQKRSSGYGDEEEQQRCEDDHLSSGWESLRSPSAVPFVWERTPGRPKSGHVQTKCFAAVACSSPTLPPGRAMKSSSKACSPLSTEVHRRNSVADLRANHRKKKKEPLLRPGKESSSPFPSSSPSPRRKKPQVSLAELLARKSKAIGAASPSNSSEEVVSESEQSESFMAAAADPPPLPVRSSRKPAWDDPGARDFILKRFLPAARAMADESTTSSSPFSSPLQPQASALSSSSPSSSSPRKQVAASVERIQTNQYKFARQQEKNSSNSTNEAFALKACGFFSFNFAAALRHLHPASRLKRSSNTNNTRAANRFAADDFRSSMLVERVNGDLTIKHEGDLSEPETENDQQATSLLRAPRRLPKSPDLFYDCDTSFEPVFESCKPKTPARSYPVSPLDKPGSETKGFLGLPENYKPPEDPYRTGGFSPSIHSRSYETDMMNARNQTSLAQRLVRFNNNEGSGSPLSWSENSEKRPGMELLLQQLPARVKPPASPVSSLLPPKSPSQSWLWKALPLKPDSKETSGANWETTVKSRQPRPDHLRYSEENALESCQYYPVAERSS